MTANLSHFKLRMLSLLASIVADQDVVVTLTHRLRRRSVVAFENRTLLLQPSCGLFDLCLAAQLVKHRRREAREARCGNKLSIRAKHVSRWVQHAQRTLIDDYPQIQQLGGQFQPQDRSTWPYCTWSQVEFEPLDSFDLARAAGAQLVQNELVEITGADDDFSRLLAALRCGSVATEHYPALAGMPVTSVPLLISAAIGAGPRFEEYERRVKEFAQEGAAEALTACYVRKSETAALQGFRGQRQKMGLVLDITRLVEIVTARHTGREPMVFRSRSRSFEPNFDASKHLVIVAMDLHGFRRGSLDDPAFSDRAVGTMLKVYGGLGVDLIVLGFADHVVELSEDKLIYLHSPIVLKAVDEPLNGAFYNRLISVIEKPPQMIGGTPACFHPLLIRTVLDTFRKEAELTEYSYQALVMAAKRGMPDWPEFQEQCFLRRTALLMEQQLNHHAEGVAGVFDHLGCFIPYEIRLHAVPGGAVSKMF